MAFATRLVLSNFLTSLSILQARGLDSSPSGRWTLLTPTMVLDWER